MSNEDQQIAREIDAAANRLAGDMAVLMRGHRPAVIMAALTTSLAIWITTQTDNTAASDRIIAGCADKMRRLVERTRRRASGRPQ